MSLRGRLLVLLVLMNLLVLGVIQVIAAQMKNQFFARESQNHLDLLERVPGFLLPAGISLVSRDESMAYTTTIKAIFEPGRFDGLFRDVLISKGRRIENQVDLNPLGCAHRDHATFDMEEILAGISEAMKTRTLISAAGGRCVAIKSENGEVEGGAWFIPALPQAPQLTFGDYALPLLISMVLFAVLASWIVGRTVGRPLEELGAAAHRVEIGDYSARVPNTSASELKPLVEAFNAMATKVEGHTVDLQSQVEAATQEAAAKERAMLVASRLASIGTLAAGVAHEINNPIGGMLNAVNRLAQGENRGEKERLYLDLIRKGLERVARTSRKLLDFAPRIFEPVEFSLADAVEQARALAEHRIVRQGVTFETSFPDPLPLVLGEPNEVQQVVLNLIFNSLNAMKDLPDRHIRVWTEVQDNRVELIVADDGPGVDEATLRQVMDPFFSGSNASDATGLGLFICYTIMQNHGATMVVESRLGEGFTVHLGFPLPPG